MKLLVCDVEGTIFKAQYRIEGTEYASTMWQPLARCLGEPAVQEEKETHDRWKRKEYKSYIEWVEATIAIHKKYGLRKADFDSLIETAEYNDGVLDFFDKLDRSKYVPVLVSGGFQELIRKAQRDLNIKYGYGACEYHFHEDGMLMSHNLTPCDFDGKYDYIKGLFSVYGLNANEDWVFIGDGKNDVNIARKAPLRICINPHDELRSISDYTVEDFSAIHSLLKENEETILLRSDLEDRPAQAESPNEWREVAESLKEVVINLKNENNELRQRIIKGDSKDENRRSVSEGDYVKPSPMALDAILAEVRVVFFGSQKERRLYQALDSFHKNLTVISGVAGAIDTRVMEGADFIFTFHDCMSHTRSWKAGSAKEKVPFANIYRDNIDMCINAMSNVLYREFYDTKW